MAWTQSEAQELVEMFRSAPTVSLPLYRATVSDMTVDQALIQYDAGTQLNFSAVAFSSDAMVAAAFGAWGRATGTPIIFMIQGNTKAISLEQWGSGSAEWLTSGMFVVADARQMEPGAGLPAFIRVILTQTGIY